MKLSKSRLWLEWLGSFDDRSCPTVPAQTHWRSPKNPSVLASCQSQCSLVQQFVCCYIGQSIYCNVPPCVARIPVCRGNWPVLWLRSNKTLSIAWYMHLNSISRLQVLSIILTDIPGRKLQLSLSHFCPNSGTCTFVVLYASLLLQLSY